MHRDGEGTGIALSPAERAALSAVEGLVFDVQRYSLHDGPGVRTAILFKGCPLRCGWCSNPESQAGEPEWAVFARQCIGCGQFDPPCPESRGGGAGLEERAGRCPAGGVRRVGERRAAGSLIAQALRDAPFYEEGGGITLTGGEPLLQPHFAEALLRLARAEGLGTALESCGHAPWEAWERLLPHLDAVLFDLKHADSAVHRAHTGVGNEQILANLRRLAERGAPVTARVPLIPGFNATAEALRGIAGLVAALKGPPPVDLLPYHTMGRAKYAALGRAYPWEGYERVTALEAETLADVMRACGIAVTVL